MRFRSRTRPIASPASNRTASDPVSGTLRAVTVVAVVIYFFAATAHSGLVGALSGVTAPIAAAAIVEAILGLVLLEALLFPATTRVAYSAALLGTLFGLAIVVVRGLGGFDLGIHFAMLALLAFGFALIFRGGATRSI